MYFVHPGMETSLGPGNTYEHQRWHNDTKDLLVVGSFLRVLYIGERNQVLPNMGKYTVGVAMLGIAPWVRMPDQPPVYQ